MASETKIYEAQITAYLERLARALRRLKNTTAFALKLQPLQLEILLFLLHAQQRKITVNFLAEELEVSEPTISDSLAALVRKKYVVKYTSPEDRRIRFVSLTASGKKIAQKAEGKLFPLAGMDPKLLEDLSRALHELVGELFAQSFIRHARICKTCHFFSPASENAVGHCTLLNKTLYTKDLQSDCPDHAYARIG